MGILDLFKALAVALFPKRNPSPDESFRFNLTVFGVLMILSGYVVWSLGFLAAVGLPTSYASASDLQTLTTQISSVQKQQAQNTMLTSITQLREAQEKLCAAQQLRNQEALNSAYLYLETLKNGWRQSFSGIPAPVPRCSELLIGSNN